MAGAAGCMHFIFLLLFVSLSSSTSYNPIDNCWRRDANWAQNRMKLAECGVGFGSAAKGGKGGEMYTVTSSDDNAVNPQPGSLRYGVTRDGPLWIVFGSDMKIKLETPLFLASHKTIDARGSNVHIGNGPCIGLFNVSNIIIHGLNIHDCKPSVSGNVVPSQSMRPHEMLDTQDGDAISVISSREVWIDHNDLSSCADGLVDVTVASTGITVSNNRFSSHDKVMLLGHSDGYTADKDMKVTVAFNHFGPGLAERMPRHGYVHVANNNYEPWRIYAIGGSAGPVIRSEGNYFVAPKEEYKKQVTWREGPNGNSWLWKSVRDAFANGAYFRQSGKGKALPNYNSQQIFKVFKGTLVPKLTHTAGTLYCTPNHPCL